MKDISILLTTVCLFLANVATAEQYLSLELNSKVCGAVKKITTTYQMINSRPLVVLDVGGEQRSYILPMEPMDLQLATTAFLSSQKFCALQTTSGVLKHTIYSLGE